MQNLDQIRAAAALNAAKDLERSAISSLPGLILSNGLLSAAAFANADGGGANRDHLKKAMHAAACHLAARKIVGSSVQDIPSLLGFLSKSDAMTLQRATTETLAFLAYLKRFAEKKKNEKKTP